MPRARWRAPPSSDFGNLERKFRMKNFGKGNPILKALDTRPEPSSTQISHSKSDRALDNFARTGMPGWLGPKIACQALGGCWRGLVPWVPPLLDLLERNRGPTMSWPTQAHNTVKP
jgi:hypothetical protein